MRHLLNFRASSFTWWSHIFYVTYVRGGVQGFRQTLKYPDKSLMDPKSSEFALDFTDISNYHRILQHTQSPLINIISPTIQNQYYNAHGGVRCSLGCEFVFWYINEPANRNILCSWWVKVNENRSKTLIFWEYTDSPISYVGAEHARIIRTFEDSNFDFLKLAQWFRLSHF